MRTFTIDVPDDVLEDLRHRIAATRMPAEMPQAGWAYGTDLAYLQSLLAYWHDEFDWRRQEQRINDFDQYLVDSDGTTIHLIHERGEGPDPLPLILTHGWPSSFLEFERLIPLLTRPDDPADAFHVVVPSLPGFGFSDRATAPGQMTFTRIADRWASLMRALGYERFGAVGGDLGSYVTARLGMHHPDRVVGIHLDPIGLDEQPAMDPAEASPGELQYLTASQAWEEDEGAYSAFQATKPRTLAFGLNDSPAGLAAYIVEKFRAWSDCDGDVERRFTKDQLLTTITLYWATGTIGSSFLPYYDHRYALDTSRVEVPVAVTIWPGDPMVAKPPPPRSYAERGFNVRRWTQMPSGGHFYASEEPVLLAQELQQFFRPLRTSKPVSR